MGWSRNPQMPGSLRAVRSVAGAGAAGTPGPWGAVPHDPRCLGPHSIRGKHGGRAGTPDSVQSCAALAPRQDLPAPYGIAGAGAGTWLHGTRAAAGVSSPDLVNLTLKIPMLLGLRADQHGPPKPHWTLSPLGFPTNVRGPGCPRGAIDCRDS